ncbi:translation initiation factor IF-2-like [Myotis myotis]|uniref:translation initiation factor IF-2-like n=1 Tax=Myotis myotis TaxID=51298 RepID=UPI00174A115A|nr:translation initiation factor IF-2-like [Myotis myotis]
MHRSGARGHTFPASCDGRTRSFLHVKYTFQSANARSQQRVDPGRATERKGAFRPLPEFPGLGGEPAGPCAPLGPPSRHAPQGARRAHSPGAGRSGGGAAAAAGRKPSERRKFLGPSLRPPRARSRRAARRPAPMSGWATCDPREPGRPLLPARLARSRGLPHPAGNSDVRNFPGPRRAETPPAPRTSPLPCSPEATIRAGGAGRVVRERARAWGGR